MTHKWGTYRESLDRSVQFSWLEWWLLEECLWSIWKVGSGVPQACPEFGWGIYSYYCGLYQEPESLAWCRCSQSGRLQPKPQRRLQSTIEIFSNIMYWEDKEGHSQKHCLSDVTALRKALLTEDRGCPVVQTMVSIFIHSKVCYLPTIYLSD